MKFFTEGVYSVSYCDVHYLCEFQIATLCFVRDLFTYSYEQLGEYLLTTPCNYYNKLELATVIYIDITLSL